MRRIPALALACLVLGSLSAGAQSVWGEREQLLPDPADPAVLRFATEIREPGSYQARLLVRGESKREVRLELELQPEAGGPPRKVTFSFTGRGCG